MIITINPRIDSFQFFRILFILPILEKQEHSKIQNGVYYRTEFIKICRITAIWRDLAKLIGIFGRRRRIEFFKALGKILGVFKTYIIANLRHV